MADELEQTVKTVLEEDHARLAEYLSIETVSAQNRGIQETVDFLKREFTKLGADNVETWQDVAIRIHSSLPSLRRVRAEMLIKRCSSITTTTFSSRTIGRVDLKTL